MMINKRLIGEVGEGKKYIVWNVLLQWISLIANITIMTSITAMLADLYIRTASKPMLIESGMEAECNNMIIITAIIAIIAIIVRIVCTTGAVRMGYLSSKAVKRILREKIYKKLLQLGASYKEQVQTSEVVQVAVEGVDQLETYFGAYLPQFFYAMLAPLTLFIYLSFINFPSAIVLLVCVPMIPVAIVAVQRWAKKLLSKYWGQYTALGDTFLENLQGLTTLKIYQADDFKHKEMNEQSENFRKITMKVLTMQLNSITIMDLIAYGGAALGVIMSVSQFKAGNVSLAGALLIIFLAADFFIPMRQLGSFFHIAMNGMAACDKIFRLLDIEAEDSEGKREISSDCTIICNDVHFSYEEDREILHGIDMKFPHGKFTAIVGESGSGKSTIAALLMRRNKNYSGVVTVGNESLTDISEESIMANFTYISHQSYLFKGSVRDNLLMAAPGVSDERLWEVLKQVKLADFLRSEQGLDTPLLEKASNLSGGQCQRLALARALLHDTQVYIFDEATSNIDAESENDIMEQIYLLAKSKTVILISHRLANVVGADNIYVLDKGTLVESGNHNELLAKNGTYKKLWNVQQGLEKYAGKEMA